MATQLHPPPHRPLLDPDQLEAAGRAFRLWLDRLLRRVDASDTAIDWEDGEPEPDRPDRPPSH